MTETSTVSAPLSLDDLTQLAVFLVQRGHGQAAVDVVNRYAMDVALVPARHPGARPTGTGWPT